MQHALNGPLTLRFLSYRDYSPLPHAQVDDAPFGGGAGMLMRVDAVASAIEGAYGGDLESVRASAASSRWIRAGGVSTTPTRASSPATSASRCCAAATRASTHRVLEHVATESLSLGPVRAQRRRAGRDGGRGRARALAPGLARRRPLERGGVVLARARRRARVPALHAAGRVARPRRARGAAVRATTRASTPGAASRPRGAAPTRAGADAGGTGPGRSSSMRCSRRPNGRPST